MDEMKTMGFSTRVNRPVLNYLPIHSSSSTMWTGPRRRAGEQLMRTASQEELIWLASTVRRRRSSCLSTAKPAASGSASSTIPQREVSRACEQWKKIPHTVLNVSLFQSHRLHLERRHASRSHQLGSRGAQQPRRPGGLCRDGEQLQRNPLLVERPQL